MKAIGLHTGLVVAVLVLCGCQNYFFEEVSNTTFRAKRIVKEITTSYAADIVFIIDNSGSMVGEQKQLAESFRAFASELEDNFGVDYRIAIVTTGMASAGCPSCDAVHTRGCINETGEHGRFQDRIGTNLGSDDHPAYEFRTDPACRIVTRDNKACFFDEPANEGTVYVGAIGCGYERGLAAVRSALGDTLRYSANDGFLRDNATLVVVVISDEEDCGEVGDITEGLPAAGGDICDYAAKGIGPNGESVHPDDPASLPYRLTPVEDYLDFLMNLKGNRKGAVKFGAIVGVRTVEDLSTTTTEYVWNDQVPYPRWDVVPVCTTAGCVGEYCYAKAGTRYIELAQMFGLGEHGFVDTICQDNFIETMRDLATFIGCQDTFGLSEPILDPDLASVLINDEPVARYSCQIEGRLDACGGPGDDACAQGDCVETWSYVPPSDPPEQFRVGGTIRFAEHYNPCDLFPEGTPVRIEVVYITP